MQPARSPQDWIPPADHEALRALLRKRTGLVVEPGREYFAELRLGALAAELGFSTSRDLLDAMRQEEGWGMLQQRVCESLAVGETSFFRDFHPFEALRQQVLPALAESRRGTRTLRVWSAATSTGQEAWSLAMTLADAPELAGWHVQLVASDFSRTALARAQAGRYGRIDVNRGLPAAQLLRWFQGDGPDWCVRDELRARIEFRELNLAQPWPAMPAWDVVFLRNVLVYLDPATRRQVLRQLAAAMAPDGWLFVGGSEGSLRVEEYFSSAYAGRALVWRPRREGEP